MGGIQVVKFFSSTTQRRLSSSWTFFIFNEAQQKRGKVDYIDTTTCQFFTMIIISSGKKKKKQRGQFDDFVYIIMMMTIHRNHCVEKSFMVSVSHLCRRLYKNNQNGVCRFFCKEKKKTKKKLLCVQKERKVTPNKSLYFHYIYIYTSAVGYVKMVFRFFLSLWLVMFQCSSASGAVLERVRVLTQQVVAESVVGNRTSTGSHVRSLSSVLCLLNSTFFFFFVWLYSWINFI
jgi:hypothetical protein